MEFILTYHHHIRRQQLICGMELHKVIPNTMELVKCKNAMMIMTVPIWTHLTGAIFRI